MSAPAPPPTVPQCPECGTKQDDARKGARKHIRAGFWFPVVCTLVAAGAIAVASVRGVATHLYNFQPHEPIFQFPDRYPTLADVRALAADDGNRTGSVARLARSLAYDYAHEYPPRARLAATFVRPSGLRIDARRVGWPRAMASWGTLGAYDDVRTLSGSLAAPNMTNEWYWTWEQVMFYRGGTRDTYRLFVTGLGTVAAVVVVITYLPRAWKRLQRRRPRQTRRSRLVRSIIVFGVAIAVLVMCCRVQSSSRAIFNGFQDSLRVRPVTDDSGRLIKLTGTHEVCVTEYDVESLLGGGRQSPSEQDLARAFLSAAPLGLPEDRLLVMALIEEPNHITTSSTGLGEPWLWGWIQERTWDRRMPPAPARWRWDRNYLSYAFGIDEPTAAHTSILVSVPGALTTLVALWLVYQVSSLPLWLWRGRRIRKRTARGECLTCGYDLKVPAPSLISSST
jgi:hypothetical protein